MSFGVFIHRPDSIYDDHPAERYQFPKMYLNRIASCEGNWIIYYEPTKVRHSKGYYAVAKVEKIVPDPTSEGMFLALMEPGSYFEFPSAVPFVSKDGWIEKGLLNENGNLSGRAQSAMRTISNADFSRITDAGLKEENELLPRFDDVAHSQEFAETQSRFEQDPERERMSYIGSRIVRDRLFRRNVLAAYDSTCAITGLKLINGGGRAEVQAAHIKPVEKHGPDSVQNGLALSGTVHWMFDRGMITLADNLEILISRHVNDRDSIEGLINKTRFAYVPTDKRNRPLTTYLSWHRANCFKA